MKVLIIEDEKLLADSIQSVLERKGFEVECVYDGETGAEYAELGIYDLLILDVMMPKMNGCQVAREVRAKRCGTPILMLRIMWRSMWAFSEKSCTASVPISASRQSGGWAIVWRWMRNAETSAPSICRGHHGDRHHHVVYGLWNALFFYTEQPGAGKLCHDARRSGRYHGP